MIVYIIISSTILLLGFLKYRFNYTKWELHQADVKQIRSIYNSPLLGSELISESSIIVDIYKRRNKYNDEIQYKKVVKC